MKKYISAVKSVLLMREKNRLSKPKYLFSAAFSILAVGCADRPDHAAEDIKSEVLAYNADAVRPNIVYIMADDLGYGDLGAYGQTKIQTPNIDLLAEEGILFTDHYAASPVCGPSRASLLTGLHSGHSPIRGNPRWTASGTPVELGKTDFTVAQMLKGSGYNTAVIGKWALSDAEEINLESMPSAQGFDYFYGYKTHQEAHHYYWHRLFKNNEPVILEGNDYLANKGKYTHDLFTEEAIGYIEEADRSIPFFMYLAYTIPHLAVTVPEDSKQAYVDLGWPEREMNTEGHYRNDPEGNTAYAGMVSRMDRDIGRIKEALVERGMAENTLIIFTSDNGHEYDQDFFDSNGPLKGRKRDLYEGGIRIPFIASWPGTITPATTTDHPSAFWDFFATACDLAGVEECPKTDGISYVPTMLGLDEQQQDHELMYWEFNERQGPIQAVRSGQWKLVKFLDRPAELYDLSADIGEENNLADLHPQLVEDLLARLLAERTDHPEFPLTPITLKPN